MNSTLIEWARLRLELWLPSGTRLSSGRHSLTTVTLKPSSQAFGKSLSKRNPNRRRTRPSLSSWNVCERTTSTSSRTSSSRGSQLLKETASASVRP